MLGEGDLVAFAQNGLARLLHAHRQLGTQIVISGVGLTDPGLCEAALLALGPKLAQVPAHLDAQIHAVVPDHAVARPGAEAALGQAQVEDWQVL